MILPEYMGTFQHHDFTIVDATKWGKPDHYRENSDYLPLEKVLCAAYAQAAQGKGRERHALGDPFLEQPIIAIGQLLKSPDGEAYQVIKKLREGLQMAKRGETDAAIREFLGAINYAAAVAILVAEEAHARNVASFESMQQHEEDRLEREFPVQEGTFTIPGLTFPEADDQPTKDQYLYALMNYGPESIDALNERIGYTLAAESRIWAMMNIACIAVEFDSKLDGRKRFTKAPAPVVIARRAIKEWRRAEISKKRADDDDYED